MKNKTTWSHSSCQKWFSTPQTQTQCCVFVSEIILPHFLPLRHEKCDHWVMFSVSGLFSFTIDTKIWRVFMSGVFPYLDYISIFYILDNKIQIMIFFKKKFKILIGIHSKLIGFWAPNFHLKSTWNMIRTAWNCLDSEWKLDACLESDQLQLKDMGHRKVLELSVPRVRSNS